MVGEFMAHDSTFSVLKLESRGYDRSRYLWTRAGLALQFAFAAKRTWTGR
jgi:hypothetical protein